MTLYDETPAGYYDLLFTGLEGDVEFYVEEAQRSGSPVLELGCGTGRIVIPTAEAGIEVTGLDVSPFMLDAARRKVEKLEPEVKARIRLVQGDMRDFSLAREFPLITIPYRAFLHMLTAEDQRRALACIREHLAPDGRLVVNFFDPKLDCILGGMHETKPEMVKSHEEALPESGHRVIFYTRGMYYPETQSIAQESLFEELDGEGNVIRRTEDTCPFRWIYRYEMEHLLARCGFEVEALYGDFQRGPYRYGGEQIWVTRRAG